MCFLTDNFDNFFAVVAVKLFVFLGLGLYGLKEAFFVGVEIAFAEVDAFVDFHFGFAGGADFVQVVHVGEGVECLRVGFEQPKHNFKINK